MEAIVSLYVHSNTADMQTASSLIVWMGLPIVVECCYDSIYGIEEYNALGLTSADLLSVQEDILTLLQRISESNYH